MATRNDYFTIASDRAKENMSGKEEKDRIKRKKIGSRGKRTHRQ